MRPFLVLLHRLLGLAMAPFLIVAGLTGALIAWDHELDAWLNPQLYRAAHQGNMQSPLKLAAQLEIADPRMLISYLPLATVADQTLMLNVTPRLDPATGESFVLGFNQLALDPVTGDIQGVRDWGAMSLGRKNLLPFLYKLHYSLHIPDIAGLWLMGSVAVIWVFDSFIALSLAFPTRSTWIKSFAFRWRKGGYALTFDLHRSGGVWVWGLLLAIAVTSVAMNLNEQVMRPLVAVFSPLAPDPSTNGKHDTSKRSAVSTIRREDAVSIAEAEAQRRRWQVPAGAVFYSPEQDVYGISFFVPGNDHGNGGLGNPWLYLDGHTGGLIGATIPGTGSAGDIFLQAQFPVHSGRIAGLIGRIFVSIMGLVITMLSITGLFIWWKKYRARRLIRAECRQQQASRKHHISLL